MNTLMIFSDFQELPKLYLFHDVDLRRFDGVIINDGDADPDIEKELNNFLYGEDGNWQHGDKELDYDKLKSDEFSEDINGYIIRCGFAP